ncbi:sarcalumenin-like isoform X1 [Styela clava]
MIDLLEKTKEMRLLSSAVIFVAIHVISGNGNRKSKKSSTADESNLRPRDLIHETLRYDRPNSPMLQSVLDELVRIYENTISPLEQVYQYNDLSAKGEMTVGQIKARPMVLFLGPWSTGKTTMINYLLDNDVLRVGAEPTTAEFTIVSHGEKEKNTEGVVVVSEKMEYSALEKFGQHFMERFSGVELPHPLLKKVTFVDTPGIIENRKQQERGYPFNKVIQWFIDKADLIFIVFDPTKLDVGLELETLFKQLKGKESQIRLILNKADSLSSQELMRVYGALFWSLAPLINVTEPPRIYTGSFWPYKYKPSTNTALFKQEEMSLLQDLNDVIENRLENKVAFVRQHAQRVRIHSLLVDEYLTAYIKRNSFFKDPDAIIEDLVSHPEHHNIFQNVWSRHSVSQFDMPSPSLYSEFFSLNPLTDFKPLQQYCRYFNGCEIDKLENSIFKTLPELLARITSQQNSGYSRYEL